MGSRDPRAYSSNDSIVVALLIRSILWKQYVPRQIMGRITDIDEGGSH